jgi:hypothetical protein
MKLKRIIVLMFILIISLLASYSFAETHAQNMYVKENGIIYYLVNYGSRIYFTGGTPTKVVSSDLNEAYVDDDMVVDVTGCGRFTLTVTTSSNQQLVYNMFSWNIRLRTDTGGKNGVYVLYSDSAGKNSEGKVRGDVYFDAELAGGTFNRIKDYIMANDGISNLAGTSDARGLYMLNKYDASVRTDYDHYQIYSPYPNETEYQLSLASSTSTSSLKSLSGYYVEYRGQVEGTTSHVILNGMNMDSRKDRKSTGAPHKTGSSSGSGTEKGYYPVKYGSVIEFTNGGSTTIKSSDPSIARPLGNNYVKVVGTGYVDLTVNNKKYSMFAYNAILKYAADTYQRQSAYDSVKTFTDNSSTVGMFYAKTYFSVNRESNYIIVDDYLFGSSKKNTQNPYGMGHFTNHNHDRDRLGLILLSYYDAANDKSTNKRWEFSFTENNTINQINVSTGNLTITSGTINIPEIKDKISVSLTVQGTSVKATVTVTEGVFDHYKYKWDSNSYKDTSLSNFTSPTTNGTHTLTVIGVTKNYVESSPAIATVIIGSAPTPTPYSPTPTPYSPTPTPYSPTPTPYSPTPTPYSPTPTPASPTPTPLNRNETISIIVTQNTTSFIAAASVSGGNFSHFEYSWNGEDNKTTTDNVFPFKTSVGQHTLRVVGVTESGKKSDPVIKVITVDNPVNPVEPPVEPVEPPEEPVKTETIEVYLQDKTTYIEASYQITNGVFSHYEYSWDDGTTLNYVSNKFYYPTTSGDHVLKVVAVTENDVKSSPKSMTVKVDEMSNGEESVETKMTMESWMKVNSDLKSMAITLTHGSKKDKENQNVYAINDEIIYTIDYKNGSADIDSTIKIVLKLPLEFTAVSTNGGSVDKTNRTITWTIKKGLDRGASGSKVAKIKYKSLRSSGSSSEVIYPEARLYYGAANSLKDSSAVVNLIFKSESKIVYDDHRPILLGDGDGLLRPDDGMSRAEAAIVVTRIYGINVSGTLVVGNEFTDLDDTYTEAQKAIVACSRLGIITGFPDGSYKPNDNITNAEFMKILASFVEFNADQNDVSGLYVKPIQELVKIYKNPSKALTEEHWAIPYVTLLERLKMLPLSDKDLDLRLDEPITRAEVCRLACLYLLRGPQEKGASQFIDVTSKHKLYGYIIEATLPEHQCYYTSDGTEIKSK